MAASLSGDRKASFFITSSQRNSLETFLCKYYLQKLVLNRYRSMNDSGGKNKTKNIQQGMFVAILFQRKRKLDFKDALTFMTFDFATENLKATACVYVGVTPSYLIKTYLPVRYHL